MNATDVVKRIIKDLEHAALPDPLPRVYEDDKRRSNVYVGTVLLLIQLRTVEFIFTQLIPNNAELRIAEWTHRAIHSEHSHFNDEQEAINQLRSLISSDMNFDEICAAIAHMAVSYEYSSWPVNEKQITISVAQHAVHILKTLINDAQQEN